MTSRTEKIYEKEPYQSKFKALVVEVDGDRLMLDRTAFYPGGGGQDPDVGTLSGMKVAEVQSRGGSIVHKVPGHGFQIGQEVDGELDWARRWDLMKAHTGEHLLFSALNRLVPDLELVKIAITPSKKSFIVKGELTWDIVLQAETMVNQVIMTDVCTEEVHVHRDDPLVSESRVKLERIPGDQIRLVRIGDFDLAACAGVHVRRTGEIGLLLVERLGSAKPIGDHEVEFSVSDKAVHRALQLSAISLQVSDFVGAHPEDLLNALRNQVKEAERAREALRRYAKIWLASLRPETIGTISLIQAVTEGLDRKTLSEEATRKAMSPRTVCVLVDESEKILLVVAVSKDLTELDANLLLQELLRGHGGKGGGNKAFASGGANNTDISMEILERSRTYVMSIVARG
jgi:alanyl-tRNA synthetase